jgi:hypothetical protein
MQQRAFKHLSRDLTAGHHVGRDIFNHAIAGFDADFAFIF